MIQPTYPKVMLVHRGVISHNGTSSGGTTSAVTSKPVVDCDCAVRRWSTPGPRNGPRQPATLRTMTSRPTPGSGPANRDRFPCQSSFPGQSQAPPDENAASAHAADFRPDALDVSRRHDRRTAGDIQQDHRSRRYCVAASDGSDPGAHSDTEVTAPAQPPVLNPAVARALLRILIKASTTGRAMP
jgi:hypothetical protein